MIDLSGIKKRKPLVVLVGPTAIGKSRIAIQVAKTMNTEILTADSRQVYRRMDIGTDKPSLAERDGVRHCLIDLVDPDQPFNVGEYRRQAIVEIDRLHGTGRIPFVVGGTGLYVRALLRGLWPGPSGNWIHRKSLADEARVKGIYALYEELKRVDPVSAKRLHPHDQVKVLRALEVYRLSGRPLSEGHRDHQFKDRPFCSCVIGITLNRLDLYKRIEARVDLELAKGLVLETQRLLARGYDRGLGSMKGLGYRQISKFLLGECGYHEAVRLLKRDTRRFAKRQMTWFLKEPNIQWLELQQTDSVELAASRVLELIERFVKTFNRQILEASPKRAGIPQKATA